MTTVRFFFPKTREVKVNKETSRCEEKIFEQVGKKASGNLYRVILRFFSWFLAGFLPLKVIKSLRLW